MTIRTAIEDENLEQIAGGTVKFSCDGKVATITSTEISGLTLTTTDAKKASAINSYILGSTYSGKTDAERMEHIQGIINGTVSIE